MSTQPQNCVTVTAGLQRLLTADNVDVGLDFLEQIDAGDACLWSGAQLLAVRFASGAVFRAGQPRTRPVEASGNFPEPLPPAARPQLRAIAAIVEVLQAHVSMGGIRVESLENLAGRLDAAEQALQPLLVPGREGPL